MFLVETSRVSGTIRELGWEEKAASRGWYGYCVVRIRDLAGKEKVRGINFPSFKDFKNQLKALSAGENFECRSSTKWRQKIAREMPPFAASVFETKQVTELPSDLLDEEALRKRITHV